jgi:transposase InsO family protein
VPPSAAFAGRTADRVESVVLAARDRHPVWGARKLLAWLRADATRCPGVAASALPAASTINAILRRHGRIDRAESQQRQKPQRFERAEPNELWQMDFKGHFAAGSARCHPLTVLDDHSRYAIGLEACTNERDTTVRPLLKSMFRRYGLPLEIRCDNGPPWGDQGWGMHSSLSVWLMRLNINVIHGRPYHPQTQGKEERFHRTLKAEVIRCHRPDSIPACTRCFRVWRPEYNHERPHEALGDATPASRYRPSPREMPSRWPPIEYDPGDDVRRIQHNGVIDFQGRRWYIGKAFRAEPVALRATGREDEWAVYYCRTRLKTLDFLNATGDL